MAKYGIPVPRKAGGRALQYSGVAAAQQAARDSHQRGRSAAARDGRKSFASYILRTLEKNAATCRAREAAKRDEYRLGP